MRQFDNKERAFLVQKFSDLKSCVLVQRVWRAAYKGIRAPNHKTRKNMFVKFEQTGSVDNQARKSPATEEKRKLGEIDIEKVVSEFPSLSITKIAQATKTPWIITR